MEKLGLHCFPAMLCALTTCTFIISYSVAAATGHASVLFPFISDTGAVVPESCIFAQLLNIASALGCFCVYCWHKLVVKQLQDNAGPVTQLWFARAAMCVGLGSSFSISLVANFPETSVMAVHLIGAILTFGLGTCYALMTAYITHAYLRSVGWIRIVRYTLGVVAATCFLCMFTFVSLAKESRHSPPHKWSPQDEGFVYHALGSFSEWLLATAFLGIFGTMCYELRNYTIQAVELNYRWAVSEDSVLPIIA